MANSQIFIYLGIFLMIFQRSFSSSSRSQSYKPYSIEEDSEIEPSLMLADDNSLYGDENSDETTHPKNSFSATGQYSKSILVNTQSKNHSHIYDPDMPIFDLDHSTNVTALLGKTAVLNCRVRNVENKTVSWIRHRDIHLLTVGRFSYTTDQRFSAVHADESEDWLLKIHYLQKRDAGWYTCQISTTPPVSNMVYLTVVEPETSISGSSALFINSGSRLSLVCSVKYSPAPPAFIFWYHNGKLISYDQHSGEIKVTIEKGTVSTSRLLVQVAGMKNSGTYTCHPSNSSPKNVTVHVLQGESPAAIHYESNGCLANSKVPTLLNIFVHTICYLTLVLSFHPLNR